MSEIPVSHSEFWTRASLPLKSAALAVLTIAAIAGVIVYSWRTPVNQTLLQVALSLILAGALGNLYDRINYGYVIDFIEVYFRTTAGPRLTLPTPRSRSAWHFWLSKSSGRIPMTLQAGPEDRGLAAGYIPGPPFGPIHSLSYSNTEPVRSGPCWKPGGKGGLQAPGRRNHRS